MRRFILACGLLLAFAGMATAAAAAVGSNTAAQATATTGTSTTASTTTTSDVRDGARAVEYWSRHIRRSRTGTRRWLTVIHGRPPHRFSRRALSVRSVGGLRRLARRWHRREHRVWWQANHPPHFSGWLCIHRYEGSWTDSGSPYWGGLQMDFSFQATYGSWLLRHRGTADHWSPLEQIWVAVRAARVRGFSPWPNTARFCGLA